jgi:formamidopyrimidine-DNA glycosylase
MLRRRRGGIKALLLNQRFLRGVGNIYADEALFLAGVHPLERAFQISAPRARRLWEALRRVLEEAIARGGSSVSDYVDADGRSGWFQLLHRVYRRHGEPCPVCGTKIRRILVAQRGTHFCPRCQRQRMRAR